MKTPTINVTQQLIDEATLKDSNHCMIADAIRAKYPDAQGIKVDTQSIRFSLQYTGKRYFYFTPPLAQQRLIAFDKGETVKPFKFLLVEGVEKPKSLGEHSPPAKKRKRPYRKSGKKKIVPKRHREFGLRSFTAKD